MAQTNAETRDDALTATNDALDALLDADARIDALTDADLKAVYVRVRLARDAKGAVEHAEIVDWLADPCDDYLGTFAKKRGFDVSPWTDDVVDALWNECIKADVADADALDTVRASLKRRARESVGTPDATVLTRLLGHYADA